jgi:glycine dehydrogenase
MFSDIQQRNGVPANQAQTDLKCNPNCCLISTVLGAKFTMTHATLLQCPSETQQSAPFVARHIGPRPQETQQMLRDLGYNDLDELMQAVVPSQLLERETLNFPAALTEDQCLTELAQMAAKNQIWRSFIGLGYQAPITPTVILRNVLENPGWYTQYTPYQAEISQGRLEALLNFQTMVCDLTGLPVANASLLDEGTAAAEAMTMALRLSSPTKNTLLLDADLHPQTKAVVEGRALPLGINIEEISLDNLGEFNAQAFGLMLAYPASQGLVRDLSGVIEKAKASEITSIVVSDLLSLVALKSPAAMGAEICVGSTQRFGFPLGFGGPHAAFLAADNKFKRSLPGRIIGVSVDRLGNPALRLALQTREQHIRRDKATSNICTAQVLPAVVASMYAVYHGPQGLQKILADIHAHALKFAQAVVTAGHRLAHQAFLDTVTLEFSSAAAHQNFLDQATAHRYGVRTFPGTQRISLAFDERTTAQEVENLISFLGASGSSASVQGLGIPESLVRREPFLTHENFHKYASETEMLRYLKRLENRDLSLAHSMVPLGSCTMKLNATSEMIPITWPAFADLHPAAPAEQTLGYQEMLTQCERMLCEITGFHSMSLQPNAGSQGEYAGLLTIRAYHHSRGESHRKHVLIPTSAHGTNPASAVMAGFETVVVRCDNSGNIDVAHLREQAEAHSATLAALMITYPSTHGVFEDSLLEVLDIVHKHGGQVYLDGANFNAMVGWCRPGRLGADVCHLNLHKTFCIPHGGGGPGMGPIGVAKHLAPFLPAHPLRQVGGEHGIAPISAAPWGSACIMAIVWVYLRMMGAQGLREATAMAILNANYLAKQLSSHFQVLYTGKNGLVAHECILDLRPFKATSGVEVEDVAKRLIDYSFHAPTMSWPVAGTLMVEPTESEGKAELDRFVIAMKSIAGECAEIEKGNLDRSDNPLKMAPHTAPEIASDGWNHAYGRELAAYPIKSLRDWKFWPHVARVDNAKGDRNLVCSCTPMLESHS